MLPRVCVCVERDGSHFKIQIPSYLNRLSRGEECIHMLMSFKLFVALTGKLPKVLPLCEARFDVSLKKIISFGNINKDKVGMQLSLHLW